jgi:ABC-type transport system involved in multi-copper enzyme maturation permease subunit
MKSIKATLWVETLKARKSKIFWGTIILFMFISSMMGVLMFVQLHPDISGKLGMIGNKASMMRFGAPNWKNYLVLFMQGIAGVGLIGIGFVTSWVFGREFSEHTLKDILAIPVSRSHIVYSKFIVVIVWSFFLSLVYFVFGLLIGFLIGLPDWSGDFVIQYAGKYFITTILILLLSTPVAFLASYSRGYLIPLGFVILTLLLANFIGMVGLGPYFPWAMPGLYGTPGVTAELQLHFSSYVILICTCLAGLYGTIAFWRFADQK